VGSAPKKPAAKERASRNENEVAGTARRRGGKGNPVQKSQRTQIAEGTVEKGAVGSTRRAEVKDQTGMRGGKKVTVEKEKIDCRGGPKSIVLGRKRRVTAECTTSLTTIDENWEGQKER